VTRVVKIGAVAVWTFVVTLGLIVGYWWFTFDPGECGGGECVLEYAAVVTGAFVKAALIGAAGGFVTYALTGRNRDQL
jgi:hypothetical protein